MLTISPDQLAFIIEKAREFDAEVAPLEPDPGSNPTDDGAVAILEDRPDNPAREELATAIDALDDHQKVELLALLFVGRGDFDKSQWREAMVQARDVGNEHETDYLVATPLLADYIEEALDQFGYAADDFRAGPE
jgi:hypothetical protein